MTESSNDVGRMYGRGGSFYFLVEKYAEEIVHKVERYIFVANDRVLRFPRRDISSWQKEVLAFHKSQREIAGELARVRDQSLDTRMDFRTCILDIFFYLINPSKLCFLGKNKDY